MGAGELVRAFSGGFGDCARPGLTPPFPTSILQQALHPRPGGTNRRGEAEGACVLQGEQTRIQTARVGVSLPHQF